MYNWFNLLIKYSLLLFMLLLVMIGCGSKSDSDKLNFLKRGNAAYESGEIHDALRYFNEALSVDSTFVDAWNNKGLTLMQMQRFDEAIYCFDQAISYKPEYAEAFLNNARAHLEVHQHYAAMEQLEGLGAIWPDTSLLPFTAGLIYADMDRKSEAIQAFWIANERDTTNVETFINLANLYYQTDELDTAKYCIERAIMLDANKPEAYNVLAMIYVEQEFFDDALQTIEIAEAMNKDAYVLNNKGFILYKLNRLEDAEEVVVRSMKMDPYNAWVYRNLGLIKEANGLMPDALRLLEKAYSMDRSIDNIFIDLARVYYKSDQHDQACQMLAEAKPDEEVEKLKKEWCK